MHEIIRVERYLKQLDAIIKDFPRLPEALAELEATLCKNPEMYPAPIGMEIYRAKLVPYAGVPALSIYFRYDEKNVYLLLAEIVDAEE